MAYNRWLSKPQNGSELYHYGVKGMRWKHHKSVAQMAYDALGGGVGKELEQEFDNMEATDGFSDPKRRDAYWELARKYRKTPVGRVEMFKERSDEMYNDIVYDKEAKTPKEKGKLIIGVLLDYLKNG